MNTPRRDDFTAAVVALKGRERAKSRLNSLADDLRQALATAMAVDTLSAVSAAVDHVLVVGRVPNHAVMFDLRSAIEEVAEPATPGLNPALVHGARLLRERGVAVVVACVGDLPALRPESVRRVLGAARPYPRAFVPDASGTGTTMLIARQVELDPHFGTESARAHVASGARVLEPPALMSVIDARTDVDTESDLEAAVRLGVGPATADVLRRLSRQRSRKSA